MTIRNFLPGFGMRTVAALAVAAAVVVAALLAVGSPASAQTPPSDEIWSATMTVGIQNHLKGWWTTDPVNIGSITDQDLSTGPNRFELSMLTQSTYEDPGNTATRSSVYIGAGKLRPYISNPWSRFNDNELESMTLHIGSHTFAFEDATEYGPHTSVGYTYSWPRPSDMSIWTSGETYAVKITAVQVVSIEAVTATVEYGGNNNVAESTAEFKFTRYGSTDNALSFTAESFLFGHHLRERYDGSSLRGNRVSATSTGPLMWTAAITRSVSPSHGKSLMTVTTMTRAAHTSASGDSSKARARPAWQPCSPGAASCFTPR